MDFSWDDEQRAFQATVREFLAADLPGDWESLAHGPGTDWRRTFSKRILWRRWAGPACWCRIGRSAGAGAMLILDVFHPRRRNVGGGRAARRPVHECELEWPDDDAVRFRGAAATLHPADGEGADDLVPGILGAGGGFGSRVTANACEQGVSTYRINGQKIWTSYAGHADTCILLARASPELRGISVFLLPMDTPGITVRQIPSVIGEGDIHEVFFDDVAVLARAMLGEEGRGLGGCPYGIVARTRRHSAIRLGDAHAPSRRRQAQTSRTLWRRRDRTGRHERARRVGRRASTGPASSTKGDTASWWDRKQAQLDMQP